jgi:hypothetical protein
MSDLGRLRVWEDPAIRGALTRYLDVAENRRPAKFRIAASLSTELHPSESSEDALWAELDRLTPMFLERWRAIRAGAALLALKSPSRMTGSAQMGALKNLSVGSFRIKIVAVA